MDITINSVTKAVKSFFTNDSKKKF